MTYIFIRGFLRRMILKLNIIFVYETNFIINNINFYILWDPEEKINAGEKQNNKERLNLILAISKEKIFH